jgi:hypothetical protein
MSGLPSFWDFASWASADRARRPLREWDDHPKIRYEHSSRQIASAEPAAVDSQGSARDDARVV